MFNFKIILKTLCVYLLLPILLSSCQMYNYKHEIQCDDKIRTNEDINNIKIPCDDKICTSEDINYIKIAQDFYLHKYKNLEITEPIAKIYRINGRVDSVWFHSIVKNSNYEGNPPYQQFFSIYFKDIDGLQRPFKIILSR